MDGVGDMVEGVVDDVIVMVDVGGFQGFYDDFGDFFV